jgi:eukaryotic-like serine/threonine-protein kinase
MAGKDLWKSDWFLGLVVAIAVFLLSATDLVGSLDRKAYDLGVHASIREPSGDIAVVAIQRALANDQAQHYKHGEERRGRSASAPLFMAPWM